MIVLDTNVVSELMRPTPDPAVVAWAQAQTAPELAMTAITVAEVRFGIERLPEGRRKDELRAAADEVFSTFAEDVLAFDGPPAAVYADIASRRERSETPINGFDAQIASICRVRQARLATRNVKDFAGTGIEVVDPWTDRD